MKTDLELLSSSVSAMIAHCQQYDKNNSMLPSLKKHKNTIALMINHKSEVEKIQKLNIDCAYSFDDIVNWINKNGYEVSLTNDNVYQKGSVYIKLEELIPLAESELAAHK